MSAHQEPRVGDIYWLENCPPLAGDLAKTRPIVLVTTREAEATMGGLLAVACTTSAYPTDTLAIELPSHPEGKVRSGLRKKTWAVPQWTIMIERGQLGVRSGYISGKLLDALIAAVMANYRAGESS